MGDHATADWSTKHRGALAAALDERQLQTLDHLSRVAFEPLDAWELELFDSVHFGARMRAIREELAERTDEAAAAARPIVEELRVSVRENLARSALPVNRKRIVAQMGRRMPESLPDQIAHRIAGLPSTVETKLAIAAVERWLDRRTPAILVLHGPTGTGKTCAAAIFVGRGGTYVHANDLKAMSHENYGEPSERFRDLLNEVRLAVDDVAAPELGPDKRESRALYELIDARQGGGLLTLLTTNASPDQLEGLVGPRVADRIHEVGLFVSVDGPSLRRSGPA